EREPMFIQLHDPDYMPKPMYPEYIPLKDEHAFLAREQPLPLIDSPTAESSGYEYEDDESEDGPVDYPMDGGDNGDDDDDDSSRDDADDEDEDEEDKDEEEEEHLASADFTIIIPTVELVPHPREQSLSYHHHPLTLLPLELGLLSGFKLPYPFHQRQRCTTLFACPSPPPIPSPLLPSSGCLTQIQTLWMASTQALIDAVTATLPSPPLPPLLYIPPPVDRRGDIPKTEMPPRKRLCFSTLGSRYEIEESFTTRLTGGQGID
nr:hypothetical protein [Tanacetum cinerariifolium]